MTTRNDGGRAVAHALALLAIATGTDAQNVDEMAKWTALPKHLQEIVVTATRQHSWDHYAYIQKENIAAWEKYKTDGVQVIRLSDEDIQKFRRFAIPLWFKWAKKDPLAKEAFASQLAFMRTVNVGYVPDSMLVDVDGKTKLTL